MSSFSKAFQEARKKGLGVFTWNGKDYSTLSKGENFDEYRNKHTDLDRWYGNSTYRGPNNGGWGDISEDVFNKINHVPEPMSTPTTLTPTTPITPTPQINPNTYNNQWQNQFSGFGKRGAVRAWLRNNNINNTTDLASLIKSDNNVAKAFGFDTSKSGWDSDIETQLQNNYGIRGHIGGFDRHRIRELLDNNKDTNPSSPGMWVTRGQVPTWLNPQVVNFEKSNTTDTLVPTITTTQIDNNLQKYRDLANKKLTFTLTNPFTGKPLYKYGGMINYYQQGGAAEQDPQQQIIALVQAAMQGDKKATQQIQQIQAAAEQGDKSAAQIMQYIQQIMQQMQQQAQKAKHGAKLQYLALLRGECPEGTHMEYFKAGGQICKKCMQNKVQENKCGGKAKKQKMACGGATKTINSIKAEMEKCGGKMKKEICGGKMKKEKCGGKMKNKK